MDYECERRRAARRAREPKVRREKVEGSGTILILSKAIKFLPALAGLESWVIQVAAKPFMVEPEDPPRAAFWMIVDQLVILLKSVVKSPETLALQVQAVGFTTISKA